MKKSFFKITMYVKTHLMDINVKPVDPDPLGIHKTVKIDKKSAALLKKIA